MRGSLQAGLGAGRVVWQIKISSREGQTPFLKHVLRDSHAFALGTSLQFATAKIDQCLAKTRGARAGYLTPGTVSPPSLSIESLSFATPVQRFEHCSHRDPPTNPTAGLLLNRLRANPNRPFEIRIAIPVSKPDPSGPSGTRKPHASVTSVHDAGLDPAVVSILASARGMRQPRRLRRRSKCLGGVEPPQQESHPEANAFVSSSSWR